MSLSFKMKAFFTIVISAAVLCAVPLTATAKDGDLTRLTLPNGLQVLIKEDHARKVATIQFFVLVGAADEELSRLGISHLIEHMAFKGTQRRGVGQIAKEVEALGGQTNAYTSWDRTVFHVTVPSDAVSQGMDILTDAVLNPSINPEELEKEKKVVLEEILEGEERPSKKAFNLLFKTAYVKSPYRYPVIGYKETVKGFTRDDIIAFRKQWYVPQNMFLLIVGDVDPAKLAPEAERMTADLKPSNFFRPGRPGEPAQEKIRSALVRDANANETRLNIAFHVPSIKDVDVNALDLAADILGGREGSRLTRILKKEKQLVNSVSTYAITPKEPGLFVVSATLDGKNLEPATKIIMEELQRLASTPPSADELKRAKTHIESEQLYSRETVGGVASTLGNFEADLGDASYEKNYLRANQAVTPEQVSEVTAKYLAPPNATVTALVPEKDVPDFRIEQLADLIKAYTPPQSAVAAADRSDATVTRTLPNGMRVVLKPDASNPVVSLRMACLGGKRFETKTTEGIMNFIARMLTKGAGNMNEKEIARKIEDMGGRLDGFSGIDSFGLNATFFSRNLDEGLKLMASFYTNPTFPDDIVQRERNLILNSIKTAPDRPVEFAIKNLNETVYSLHPYGFDRDGTVATVSGFTRDDLSATYKRFAVPSNTVITLVGDMDVPKTMALIEELFGKIPAKPFDMPQVALEPPLSKVKEKTVRIPRAKAHLAIGFRAATLKDEDRYPLEVLSNVLSGQGGRLFLDLRDKKSLAYTVASFFRPGVDPGTFTFYIATEPSKSDEALKGLLTEIKRIREAPISDAELKRSTKNLIGHHKIAMQSSWSRAENTGLNTLYGLGPDYEPEYVRKISAVTPEQVLQVARKYLDPDRAAIVKILPEEKKG